MLKYGKEFVDNMKLKENAMSKVKGLMESPMLYLSGGSKELFHSNFLYWLGVNFREAKVKVSNDCCLVLQVQGNRYCHGIEKQNIVHNSTSLSEWLRNFIEFKFGGLLDHKSQPDSKQCHYKDGFLYKSQKIGPNFKVRHIVDAMKNDLEIILRAKLNPKMPTTSFNITIF